MTTKTKTVAPPSPLGRYITATVPNCDLCVPSSATSTPPAVADASDAVRARHAHALKTGQEAIAARQAVDEAAATDRSLAQIAAARDQPPPEPRTEAAAREALARAERAYEAACSAWREAVVVLASEIAHHKSEGWLEAIGAEISTKRRRALQLTHQLTSELDDVEELEQLALGLGDVHPHGALVHVRLNVQIDLPYREAERDRIFAHVRENGAGHTTSTDITSLVAALRWRIDPPESARMGRAAW